MLDAVGAYLEEIGRIPRLSKDEEIFLGHQVQEMMRLKELPELTRSQKKVFYRGKKAKDRMIKANLRLVVHIAKKQIMKTMTHLSLLDLIQEGTIGLNRGVEKFDPKRGYKFSTYAYWWIKQGITRAIGNQERHIRLPVNAQDVQRRLVRFLDDYRDKHGKEPTYEECAEAARVTLTTLKAYVSHVQKPFSLDQLAQSEGGADGLHDRTILDLIAATERTPEEELEIESGLDRLEELLSLLPERDRKMLEMRFGFGNGGEIMTYTEIGRKFDVSRERVRQVERKSMILMRQKLHAKHPEKDSLGHS